MSRLTMIVAGALLLVALPAPAHADRWVFSGERCTEVTTAVLIARSAAEQVVPHGFTVLEYAGRARLVVSVISCHALRVVVGASGVGLLSDVGIEIAPPDGNRDSNFYQLWHVSSRADLAAIMGAIGMPGGLVERLALTVAPVTPAAATARATVPWPSSSYEMDQAVAGGVTYPEFTQRWWRQAGERTVTVVRMMSTPTEQSGVTVLESAPGSPLSLLLGSDSAVAAGSLGRLSFTASVRG